MTTIACNREALFGDRQFTNDRTGNKWRGNTKVYRYKANLVYPDADFIVGFCGSASDMVTVSNYFEHSDMFDRPPRIRGISGLVVTAKREIFLFDDYTRWLLVKEPFAAMGTGADYARGAMSMGADPKEAVRIAMKHDAYTGFGVKGYSF